MHAHVLWALTTGVMIGIALRSFVAYGWVTIGWIAALSLAIGICGYVFRISLRTTVIATVCVMAVALGSARMHIGTLEGSPLLNGYIGERVSIEGAIVDEPDQRENNVRITVRVRTVSETPIEEDVRVLVVAPLHTSVAYGEIVRAEGELRLPQRFESGEGREFDYPGFLAKDGIGYELSFAKTEVVGADRRNPLKAAAIWIKRTYLDGLAMALPEPQAGLAAGITAGDKRGLGSELSETFRIVGLIHIVVLSGYNIMVVIGFLERFLGWTSIWVRSSLSVAVAVFFALITGLASASVRAASMAVIATVGKITGREYLASRALALVALVMVFWNPFLLIYDPGFQLSILATLGLIHIAPLFVERMTRLTERFQLREIAAATLGTQAAVLPLLLYQNGSLSLYSLPANLLALIVVPYAMLLSFIAGVIGVFAGSIAVIFGFPAYVLLSYITLVARLFEWLPLSAVSVPAFSVAGLIAVYVILCVVIWIQKKRAAKHGFAAR